MFYIKSIYTNQIYKVEEMPKFGGYELATEAEYIAYCQKMGIEIWPQSFFYFFITLTL